MPAKEQTSKSGLRPICDILKRTQERIPETIARAPSSETDKREVIQDLLTHVEFDFGIDIEDPGNDDYPTS